jgi:ribosomal subunit interface protein
MKISITGRNINISEDLNKFIQEKVIKITKYDNNINSIEVVLLKESRAEKVEIIAISKTSSYIVKTHSSVFEKTILKAVDSLKMQILKSKKKY